MGIILSLALLFGQSLPYVGSSLHNGGRVVNLTWSDSDTGVTFNVYRSTTSGSGYALIGSSTATSYEDIPPRPPVTYYYVVTATDGTNESVYSNEVEADL